jgi:hypothetical protein
MANAQAPLITTEDVSRKRKATEQLEEEQEAKRVMEETRYYSKTNMTDFTIVCSDGVKLYYSKYQLAMHSPVMAAIFEGDAHSTEIKLNDYDADVVELALRFMDKNRFVADPTFEPTPEYAHGLYKLAHYWGVKVMEDEAAHIALKHPTYALLDDMKQRSFSDYETVLVDVLTSGCELPPLVHDLLEQHRKMMDVISHRDETRKTKLRAHLDKFRTTINATFDPRGITRFDRLVSKVSQLFP